MGVRRPGISVLGLPVKDVRYPPGYGDKGKLRSHSAIVITSVLLASLSVYLLAPVNMNVHTSTCQKLQLHAGMPETFKSHTYSKILSAHNLH